MQLADNGGVIGVEAGLLGRDAELAVLGDFVAARDRLPAAVLVRGEPGIGKTSVWREGVRMAREHGYCTLVAGPSQSEAQISFAALGTPLGLDRALELDRLTVVRLGPLSSGAVQRLLLRNLGTPLPRPVLSRVYELSDGSPFFALELGRACGRGSIQLELGGRLPVTLDALVRGRIAALPAGTRRPLGAAAALAQPTLTLVAAVSDGELGPALAARILELDGDLLRFTHPLLRSAAYAWLPPRERIELHRRLAGVVGDVEEQAWQLALACARPDAEVALRLDRAAARAYARGATAAAAKLAAKALTLTPPAEPPAREERSLRAAGYHFEAGESGSARGLLEQVIGSTRARSVRARGLARLARMSNYISSPGIAAERFRQALAEVEGDRALAAEIEEGLAWSLVLLREDLDAADAHAQAAVELAEEIGDVSRCAEALTVRAVARFYLGRGGPAELMRPALALEQATAHLPVQRQQHRAFGALLMLADELDAARVNLELAWRRAEERGEDGFLPLILSRLSYCGWLAGDWQRAREFAVQGYEAARRTEQAPVG